MHALTLRHPWVCAITDWNKRIENRQWTPYRKNIWLGLHGGVPPKGRARAEALADLQSLIDKRLAPPVSLDSAIRPGIVGVVRVERFIHLDDRHEPLLKDPWFHGPYGWVISEVVTFREPIECPGAQKLWEVPAEIHQEMRKRYLEIKGAA